MSVEFKKYKNKFLINAAIAASVCGISAGALAFGAVWLVLKLLDIGLSPLYYALIGAGVALVVGVILFFVFKPTEKSIAKRLDEELNLDERVQTMVEYRDEEGDMFDMQRQDACERLSQSPKIKPSLAKILKLAIMPVLACAVILTAAFVPAKKPIVPPSDDGGVTEDDVYKIDNWQIASLNQLIEEVGQSSLREGLKQSHVTVLESLLEGLQHTTTNSAMVASVRSAIAMLATATDGANNYNVFAEKFAASQDVAVSDFAEGLSSSAKVYSTGVKYKEYSQVQEREKVLYDEALPLLSESASSFYAEVQKFERLKFKSGLNTYIKAFEKVLSSVEYEEGDALAGSFNLFIEGLKTVVVNYDLNGYSLDNLKAQVWDACTSYAESAATEMSAQSYAFMVTEYETNRLCAIFGIKLTDSDDPSESGGSGGSDSDDPSEGGWGEGGVKYGSDDLIFFPDEGIYVQYGEVLNEYYYPKVSELLRSGNISDEAKQFIREYFTILNRGIKEDEAEEN
ncbi:MAG: hypothetical protein ACI4L9_03980 [Candidatus Coproplasma sp.]